MEIDIDGAIFICLLLTHLSLREVKWTKRNDMAMQKNKILRTSITIHARTDYSAIYSYILIFKIF